MSTLTVLCCITVVSMFVRVTGIIAIRIIYLNSVIAITVTTLVLGSFRIVQEHEIQRPDEQLPTSF